MTTEALKTMKITKARTQRASASAKRDQKLAFIAAIRAKIAKDGDSHGLWAAKISRLEAEG